MTKSKYTPEIVEVICEEIATTGRARDGIEAAGINPSTFYIWLKRYPNFSNEVQKAKATFAIFNELQHESPGKTLVYYDELRHQNSSDS